jgi:hypothetical protein
MMANLGRYHHAAGRLATADSLLGMAIGALDRIDDRTVVAPLARSDYAVLCVDLGRDGQAESLFVRAAAELDSANSGTRASYAENQLGWARLRARQGRADEAEALAALGFRIRSERLAPDAAELDESWLSWAAVRAPWAMSTARWTSSAPRRRAALRATTSGVSRAGGDPHRPGYPLGNGS